MEKPCDDQVPALNSDTGTLIAITPMAMIAQAVASGADIATIERLLALQERIEAAEARKAYVAAMAEFKAVPITIKKNKHVGFESKRTDTKTDYWHATLDQVVEAVGPELAKVGLSYRWKTEQLDGGVIRVTCIVRHSNGHSEETVLQGSPDLTGNKNNIQAVGSTVSYLSRYTLMSALGLASADNDGRGGDEDTGKDPQFITEQQIAKLQGFIDEMPGDRIRNISSFCKWLGVASLADLPTKDYAKALNELSPKAK